MVSLEKLGRVYILTLLGDDDEHRFHEESMGRILAALKTVHEDPDAGALVTTNEGKFYSNGFDLDWVRGEHKKEEPSNTIGRLVGTMLSMNVPTIAAICGHASAAGFLFALAHDHRYMRNDRGFLYMSEMDVKIRITPGLMNLLRSTLSPKAFKDACLLAKKFTASEAYALGIVDSIHQNSAATVEAAMGFAAELSRKDWDRNFYRTYRLDLRPGLLDSLLNVDRPRHVQHRSKI